MFITVVLIYIYIFLRVKHLSDDGKVPDCGTHFRIMMYIGVRMQTRDDRSRRGCCMCIHSLNIVHVSLVRLRIQSVVNDVQVTLRQRGDDRSNNRGRRRRGYPAGDLCRLTVGSLLEILRWARLIIAVLRLTFLLVYEQTARVTVRGAADLANVWFLAGVRELMLLEILEPSE